MFKFRKVASILASAVMLSSTVAFAAATTYPAPFVQNGAADVAVVWGTTAATTDQVAVTDIVASLNTALSQQGGSQTTTTTVTGEAYPLFSSGSKLYYGNTINSVRTGSITKNSLPTVLADGKFDGKSNVDYSQTIVLGSSPTLTFKSQPEANVDPVLGYTLPTTSGDGYLYNMSVTFDEPVNFTDTDNQGQSIVLFGKEFTVSAETSATELVLLKSAESIDLDSDNPTKTVTVGGNQYTIELRSASDTSATLKVTDSAGTSQTKTVDENAGTKTIAGLTVAVTQADETNFKLSATISVGADEVKFKDNTAVYQMVDGDYKKVAGTMVNFNGGSTGALTKLTVSNFAPKSDKSALVVANSFVDPVFGTLKVDFPSMSIGDNSTSREGLSVQKHGNDLMSVTMTDYNGHELTQDFAYNGTKAGLHLAADNDNNNITVAEEGKVYTSGYLIVPGAEGKGHLLQVTEITNDTSGGDTSTSDDVVTFHDVFSDSDQNALINADAKGSGTLTVEGDDYSLRYYGTDGASDNAKYVKVNFDKGSTGAGEMVLYPTLSTENGALVTFYQPVTGIDAGNWNSRGNALTKIMIPNGDKDSYTSQNVLENGTSATMTAGKLTFNVTNSASNLTSVYLVDPVTGLQVTQPALILWEGQDDADANNAIVVTIKAGGTSSAPIGVDAVERTYDSSSTMQQLESDDNIYKAWDYWGTISTLDESNTDSYTAQISYPDEQVNALVYIAEASATIGGGSGELGNPIFKDTETTAFQGKNLIVVGGSCVNTVAAKLLDPTATTPICGADWTTKTGADAGQYVIQTFNGLTTGKIATLVAGYNAADTTNAATYFRTQSVDTTVGKKYLGTTETQATASTVTS